ncbi:MAG: sugar phosphate isomerase/epimerase [Mariniphaga sp.]|nr:sugar phosphate isomerase/epimerase [Mariniphaga sp.]
MKTLFNLFFSLSLVLLISSYSEPNHAFLKSNNFRDFKSDDINESSDWKLAVQTYTLNRFTFEEALDKIQAGGFKYVEAYPGQDFGAGIEGKTHFSMDGSKRDKMKEMLDSRGLKLINYGVVKCKSAEEWKQVFEFASAMGIETITAEPLSEHLNLIDQMANEYGINIAIHNHPSPSSYFHPDSVLNALNGKSDRLGACADVGHWIRSGLEPVECLKKLQGKIISLHFKDLNEKSREAHDVVWGTGVVGVEAVLKELKSQNFKGVFTIEYEYNWDNNMPEVIESAEYFNQTVKKLR